MTTRPLILLSNDDGIQSVGLRALADALADLGDVVVVAPDRERSAQSHAFTMHRPLRVVEVEERCFSVDGTPADCVYLGVLKLCGRRPDLCVSGINFGYNLGSDVFYSGTVAGAVEAALRSVPSIAMSLDYRPGLRNAPEKFEHAARFAHALGSAVLAEGLSKGTLLNVNVPAGKPRGYRWTRLGRRVYDDVVEARADLRGRAYYWIGGPASGFDDLPGTDCRAVAQELVSVTPLDLDLTHDGLLAQLPDWRLAAFEAVVEADLAGGR